MKLKLIALAGLLAATGAANAAIDTGATGNGELFFSVWDGANSYTRDLNITIDAFQSGIAAAGSFNTVFNLSADSLFTSYLASANLSTLSWNISAADSLGARRLIETYSTLPATTITNDLVRTTILATASYATAVNSGIKTQGNSDSAVFAANTPGYANNASGIKFGTNGGGLLNFNNSGSFASNSYASGLNILRIDGAASGVLKSTYTPYTDDGVAVRAYLTSSGLTIAAVTPVPEPETYAMLLAGLGVMGAIARRRRTQV